MWPGSLPTGMAGYTAALDISSKGTHHLGEQKQKRKTAADTRGQASQPMKHMEGTPGNSKRWGWGGAPAGKHGADHRNAQQVGLLPCPALGWCWYPEHRSDLPSSHQPRTERGSDLHSQTPHQGLAPQSPLHIQCMQLTSSRCRGTRLEDSKSESQNVFQGTKLPKAKYRPRAPK